MTIDRAIEILNPEHLEHYESIDPVNETDQVDDDVEITHWKPLPELPEG